MRGLVNKDSQNLVPHRQNKTHQSFGKATASIASA